MKRGTFLEVHAQQVDTMPTAPAANPGKVLGVTTGSVTISTTYNRHLATTSLTVDPVREVAAPPRKLLNWWLVSACVAAGILVVAVARATFSRRKARDAGSR
jgi:hypothetical protein